MFIYKLRHDKRGMTLIEMVISLVILSILMTSTMGMITSSMSIFTSTTMASIDRMVGNSVYSTLENSLKYATHLTISDTPDADSTAQSFCLAVTDTETNSGNLQYRAKGDSYLALYDSSYYKGRTIQYDIEEVGADNRHVKITVNIYREGDIVYTKTATIKCINLALIKSSSNDNTINNKSTPATVNQYIYFAVDEMLVYGGETAWSLEYKINEYMNKYNAILAEYYGKLCLSDSPLDDALASHSNTEGNRIYVETLNSLINNRNKAIFGDGTNTVAWEGDNYLQFNNLRQHYQDEIYELLKFAPTHAFRDTSNPYYKVVATNEELYTGFMLTYYDDNKDGIISKDEYPDFSEDSDTFFDGTVLENYDGSDNGMVILCYFKDYLDDNYDSLFTKTTENVTYYNSIGMAYDPNEKVYITNDTGVFPSYTTQRADIMAIIGGTDYRTFRSTNGATWLIDGYRYGYKYNGGAGVDGTSKWELGSWSEKSGSIGVPDGYMKATDAFNTLASKFSSAGIPFINLASNNSVSTGDTSVGNADTKITITAGYDLPQGWYYYKEEDGNDKGYYIVALAAAADAGTDANGQPVAVKAGCQVALYSHNWKLYYYHYDQAQYNMSDGVDIGTRTVDIYSFKQHQYRDWFLYSVDWNSWFKTSQNGLMNSIIGGIANWFTGQSDINSISASNSDLSLGLEGKYNVNNISTKLRSYNMAWVVYSPRRSTWYYLPDSTNRLNSALSGLSFYSDKNTPVPLDCEAWGSSSKMITDIETRKLSDSTFFGLVDSTMDVIWVPLPTGGEIDRSALTS